MSAFLSIYPILTVLNLMLTHNIDNHTRFPHVLSVHAGIPLCVISNAVSEEDEQNNVVGSNYLLANVDSGPSVSNNIC